MPAPLAIGLLPKALPAIGGLIKGIFGKKKKSRGASPDIPISTLSSVFRGNPVPAAPPSIPFNTSNLVPTGQLDILGARSKRQNVVLIVVAVALAVAVGFFAFFRKRRR